MAKLQAHTTQEMTLKNDVFNYHYVWRVAAAV